MALISQKHRSNRNKKKSAWCHGFQGVAMQLLRCFVCVAIWLLSSRWLL